MATTSSSTSAATATGSITLETRRPWWWSWRVPVLVTSAVAALVAAILHRLSGIRLVPIASGELFVGASSILVTVVVGFVVLCVVVAFVPNFYVRPVVGANATSKDAAKIEDAATEYEKGTTGDSTAFVVPPVRIKDSSADSRGGLRDPGEPPPFVLSPDLAQQVAERLLPTQLADYAWIRVYSLSRDGDSFVTFLKAVENLESTLLVLRTQRGSVVGAFADSSWTKAAQGPVAFHGGPKTRLFRVLTDDSGGKQPSRVECYPWTGANRYCQLCDVRRGRIAFGGGSGGGGDDDNDIDETKGSSSFGLTLERDFLEGTTSACPTFNNPPLCEDHFAIVELEVFGFRLW